ncbi:peptide chain release factor N(5)-glutamine methyltransferase [Paenibacillus sp. YN15]|uniref:peptide chain release factor N(5)-glutamine methyltransferase n=1 Tax=Paenibacillus sp. YN15 TaxID=1742774 RepID=UPI000DCD919C|nr:peptide chain release factor N(5)-glutamine methyltransferase [Paenibacillus sp. YN15]RAU91527.1 peptide chain release factor N(5)-glutamine methyltransferase [Paenibacillus sp. YN15]
MDGSGKTIREAYVEASSFLKRHGVDESAQNGQLLLEHLLGWSKTRLYLNWQDPFPEEKELDWQRLLSRRAGGEPVQYIIGSEGFYGLTLQVTPAVLIPRPETEILVQEIMNRGKRLWPEGSGRQPLAVDIGTGSGAIPVTLATHCPSWELGAVDISEAALEVARRNAEQNGVGGRIRFLQGDLLAPVYAEGLSPDIVISNPPYIKSSDLPDLQREVRDFEPHLALDGGDDGLDFYRRLAEQLALQPVKPRLVGFEVGMGQAAVVAAMLRELGLFGSVSIVRDLAGIERHVLAEA